MPLPRSLSLVIAQQDGVVSRQQAIAHGMSPRTVARHAADERWRTLHPGIYLAEGHLLGRDARVRAAGMWAGDRAVVSGPAAAWWHRMHDDCPSTVDVTVPVGRRTRGRPGVRLRRRDLTEADRTLSRSLRVVARPLAVLQTMTVVPRGSVFLDRALQKWVTLPQLHRCQNRHLGTAGSAERARLLAVAAEGAESQAERLLVAALRAAGVTGWVLGHPAGPFRIDLAFVGAGVAVEVDGWAFHSDAERFRADRRKGNHLVDAGWKLLRFTWHDLDADAAGCVAMIVRMVREVPSAARPAPSRRS